VRRAFAAGGAAVDEELLAQAYAFFSDYYREHKLDFTTPTREFLRRWAALSSA